MRTSLQVLGAALIVVTGCATHPDDLRLSVLSGNWGGQGALMVASDSGASFTFNCASGRADGPLEISPDGQFSWSGTYARVSPVPGSPHDPPHAATYHGTMISTSQLSVALTVPDIPLQSEAVTLTFGDSGNLALCP
jgi:hypothetical protein